MRVRRSLAAVLVVFSCFGALLLCLRERPGDEAAKPSRSSDGRSRGKPQISDGRGDGLASTTIVGVVLGCYETPVTDAVATLEIPGSVQPMTAKVDGEGTFRFVDVPSRECTVLARSPNWGESQRASLSLPIREAVKVVFRGRSTLSGVVRRKEERPVRALRLFLLQEGVRMRRIDQGIELVSAPRPRATDLNELIFAPRATEPEEVEQTFLVEALGPGRYLIEGRSFDRVISQEFSIGKNGETISVLLNMEDAPPVSRFESKVYGRVFLRSDDDTFEKTALSNGRVSYTLTWPGEIRTRGETVTGPEGEYSLDCRLLVRGCQLLFAHEEHVEFVQPVVEESRRLPMDVVFRPFSGGQSLALETADGVALSNVGVSVDSSDRQRLRIRWADANGICSLAGLSNAEHRFSVWVLVSFCHSCSDSDSVCWEPVLRCAFGKRA